MTKPLSMGEAVEVFLDWMAAQRYSDRTIANYRCDLGPLVRYLTESEGIDRLDEVSRDAVLRFQNWLFSEYRTGKGKAICPGTQAHKIASVKSFFKYAARHRMIPTDPGATLRMPKVCRSLPRDILDEEEIERLLEAPDVTKPLEFRDRVMMEVFYGSGVRKSELLALSVFDLDLDRAEIRVDRLKRGEGRVIPIPPVVADWVGRYLDEVRPALVKPDSGDALFLTVRGKPFRPSNWIVERIRHYAKRAGIKKDPKCHGLRHTYSTHLLRRGMGIRQIQKLLGHKSINSTQIYTRVEPSDMKEAFHKAHPRSAEGG